MWTLQSNSDFLKVSIYNKYEMRFTPGDNDTGELWKQEQCLGNWKSQLSKKPVPTEPEITVKGLLVISSILWPLWDEIKAGVCCFRPRINNLGVLVFCFCISIRGSVCVCVCVVLFFCFFLPIELDFFLRFNFIFLVSMCGYAMWRDYTEWARRGSLLPWSWSELEICELPDLGITNQSQPWVL